MTTLTDHFPHIDGMDIGALHERRDVLKAQAPDGNYELLSDEALAEILAIGRALRKKAAAPGGSGKAKSPKKAPATLDDLI